MDKQTRCLKRTSSICDTPNTFTRGSPGTYTRIDDDVADEAAEDLGKAGKRAPHEALPAAARGIVNWHRNGDAYTI